MHPFNLCNRARVWQKTNGGCTKKPTMCTLFCALNRVATHQHKTNLLIFYGTDQFSLAMHDYIVCVKAAKSNWLRYFWKQHDLANTKRILIKHSCKSKIKILWFSVTCIFPVLTTNSLTFDSEIEKCCLPLRWFHSIALRILSAHQFLRD